MQYSVDVLPFEVSGFTSKITEGELSSTGVAIIAGAPAGFTPKFYAPPGYEAPQGGDYNRSMGLLENGNQRSVSLHLYKSRSH
jgi:hypothetical protein